MAKEKTPQSTKTAQKKPAQTIAEQLWQVEFEVVVAGRSVRDSLLFASQTPQGARAAFQRVIDTSIGIKVAYNGSWLVLERDHGTIKIIKVSPAR